MHFSKQFIQTAPHNGFSAKACNLLKIFSSSLKSIYVNEHISAIRMKSPCVIDHKQYSQNASCCQYNSALNSLMTVLYWNAEGRASHVCHISISKKYTFTHYCMRDSEWKRLDRIHSYTFTSGITKIKIKNTLQLRGINISFIKKRKCIYLFI